MSLGIKVNGEFLDLLPGSRLKMVRNNPALGTEDIPGSFGLTLDLPHSPRNDTVFGFSHLKETYISDHPDLSNADLYSNGVFMHRCRLKVNQSNEKRFQCYLQIGLSSLAETFKKTKLSDISFPDIEFANLAELTALLDDKLINPVDWVSFMVVNDALWGGDEVASSSPHIPDWMQTAGAVGVPVVNHYNWQEANPWFPGSGKGVYGFAPFPFMNPVIKAAFAQAGSFIKGNWFNDAELNKLCFYNARVLPVYMDSGNATLFFKKINLSNHVPTISVADLLFRVKMMFGQGFYSNPEDGSTEMIAHKDVLSSTEADDWTKKATTKYDIDTDEHDGFTLDAEIDGSDQTMADKLLAMEQINLLTPVATFSALPAPTVPNDVRLVQDEHYYYRTTYPFGPLNLEWTKWRTEDFVQLAVGDGSTPLNSAMPPLHMEFTNSFWPLTLNNILRPEVSQPANLELEGFKTKREEVAPRLMFYRGMDDASPFVQTWPLGSGREYNYHNQQIGNYSLDWGGANGLYLTWWSDWLRFLISSRPVKMDLTLDINDLLNLKFQKKKRIGNQLFLLRKIEYNLPFDGKATAELLKL